MFRAVPAAGPVLVGPHEAEGQVDAGVVEQGFERAVEQAFAVEPVEVEHEAVQPGGAGHLGLAPERFRAFEAVVAEVAGDARLVMAGEARQGAADVGPLREAVAPPGVGFGEWGELGKVVGEDHGAAGGAMGERGDLLE